MLVVVVNKRWSLNPIDGRPGHPGIAVEKVAATVAANGGLSIWGFNHTITI